MAEDLVHSLNTYKIQLDQASELLLVLFHAQDSQWELGYVERRQDLGKTLVFTQKAAFVASGFIGPRLEWLIFSPAHGLSHYYRTVTHRYHYQYPNFLLFFWE